jgi:hypothetical protein
VLLKLGSILLGRVALFDILDYTDSLRGFVRYTEDIADSLTEAREVLHLGLDIVEIVIGVVLFQVLLEVRLDLFGSTAPYIGGCEYSLLFFLEVLSLKAKEHIKLEDLFVKFSVVPVVEVRLSELLIVVGL